MDLAGLLLTFRLPGGGEAMGILTDKMKNGNCKPKFSICICAKTIENSED
jgi:hypothetical protein